MLSQAVLFSVLVATAQAIAQPQITPPPAMKKRFDIPGLDGFKSVVGDVSSFLDNAGDEIKSGAENAGDEIKSGVEEAKSGFDSVSACVSAVSAAFDDNAPPTPTGDLADAMASALTLSEVTNLCLATVIPSSLSADYAAYESEFASWYADSSPSLQAVADACPTLPDSVEDALQACDTALAAAGVTPVSANAGGDESGNGDGGDEGAAPRVTGVLAGVAAVAVGVAAVLL